MKLRLQKTHEPGGFLFARLFSIRGKQHGQAEACFGTRKRVCEYMRWALLSGSEIKAVQGRRVGYLAGINADREATRAGYGFVLINTILSALKQVGCEAVYLNAYHSEHDWVRAGFKRVYVGTTHAADPFPLMRLELV